MSFTQGKYIQEGEEFFAFRNFIKRDISRDNFEKIVIPLNILRCKIVDFRFDSSPASRNKATISSAAIKKFRSSTSLRTELLFIISAACRQV